MGFTRNLADGIGQHLSATGAIAYKTSGTYLTSEVGLHLDQLPTTPDRAVGLTLYPVTDSGNTDSIVGAQFRIRGRANNRADVKDTGDAIFDALHDLQAVTLGGIPVVRVWRNSAASLGADSSNRQEETHNYYLELTRTGTHRRD
ncbi:hypothetical protein GCM10023081_46770 [Arthrobacter ginkgonis]|uniref:DUF3168 domain-containing protein n=1 Tax=Arthrobacter ginkgonis TaxID=1630594 RepID=A0ABP7DMI0_9MICC